jgi:hypothetical protein
MSIEGRIAVDVSFADSATSDGVQSLKKITLADTTSYTTGKVAIVTGTCGTAAIGVGLADIVYRDASGSLVSIASPNRRLAFAATPRAFLNCTVFGDSGGSPNSIDVRSSNGQAVVLEHTNPSQVFTTAGTASYTLVLYGT